jgi:GMP synthase (glutamine-hydrolysing)
MKSPVIILDFGSQYTQLIARRVRTLRVYCEIHPWDANPSSILALEPSAFILSGGPASVYDAGAPVIQDYILESGLPILGVCYGMQAMMLALGGGVIPAASREYGVAEVNRVIDNPLLPDRSYTVWMSHGDRVETLPPGFAALAASSNTPICAAGDEQRRYYCVQFHPEVHHTPRGLSILENFLFSICALQPNWTSENIISSAVSSIENQVGNSTAISAVSGGVDSTVATTLVYRAMGNRLRAIFVDTGMLRLGEADRVEAVLSRQLGIPLQRVNAEERFLSALKNVIDPEVKRRIIGAKFIELFEQEAERAGKPPFLVQGTIYPDVIESSAPERNKAERIKSHHNVGGLPENMKFKLIEPLRYLFKDEVRGIGEALGIPADLVWRQPFPGPGLAVRCLGKITRERIRLLQMVDHILISELEREGLINHKPLPGEDGLAQAFAVLLPVRSVGVMGDQRTYEETVALRAVTSEDFMTADWARLPHALLGRISSRIVNEVKGVNRVVYDITSKPPATIEWE